MRLKGREEQNHRNDSKHHQYFTCRNRLRFRRTKHTTQDVRIHSTSNHSSPFSHASDSVERKHANVCIYKAPTSPNAPGTLEECVEGNHRCRYYGPGISSGEQCKQGCQMSDEFVRLYANGSCTVESYDDEKRSTVRPQSDLKDPCLTVETQSVPTKGIHTPTSWNCRSPRISCACAQHADTICVTFGTHCARGTAPMLSHRMTCRIYSSFS